jgi:hypothetical protein
MIILNLLQDQFGAFKRFLEQDRTSPSVDTRAVSQVDEGAVRVAEPVADNPVRRVAGGARGVASAPFKRTPISRPVSSEQSKIVGGASRRFSNPSILPLAVADHARFFMLVAATNRARHPSGSSERRYDCLSPWRPRRPRRTLVPQRVQWANHSFVVADVLAPIHGWLTLRAIRLYCKSVTATRHPIQFNGWCSSPLIGLAARRRNSCKAARHVKRFALLQNVEARPCQLVRQRFGRHHSIRSCLLPFVEPFRFWAIAHRKMGRLDIGPG